jgi:hypothetical protein
MPQVATTNKGPWPRRKNMSSTVRVTFINNDGAGFADLLEVEQGTTIATLLADQLGSDFDAGKYLIRVNKAPCAPDYVLVDGDRATVTPKKVDGA